MFKLPNDLKWFESEIEEKKAYFDSQTYFFNKELLKIAKNNEDFKKSLLLFLSCRKKDIQSLFLPALLFRYNLLKFPPKNINFFNGDNKNWFYHIENWKGLIEERMLGCFAAYAKNPRPIQTVSPWRYAFLSLVTNFNFADNLEGELRVLDIGGGSATLGMLHTDIFSAYLKIDNPLFLRQFCKESSGDFVFRKTVESVTVDLYPANDSLWYLAGNLFQNIGSIIEYYLASSINPPENFSPKKEKDMKSESWTADYTNLSLLQKELLKKKKINVIFASATFYQVSEKDQIKFGKTALEILSEGGVLTVLCSNPSEVGDFSEKMFGSRSNFRKFRKKAKEKGAGVFFSLRKNNNEFFLAPLGILFYFDQTEADNNWRMEIVHIDDRGSF